MSAEGPIGEIVETSTTTFVAQCLEVPREIIPKLYDPPPFGSFVKIGKPSASAPAPIAALTGDADEPDPFALPFGETLAPKDIVLPPAVYALVFGSQTASLEQGRRPSALGYEDEEELRAQQPQIFELLRTEFSGLLVAYSDGDKGLRRHLPPRSPRVHSRVYPCTHEEIRALTSDLSFLRGVLNGSGALGGAPADELVAACLRQAAPAQSNEQAFLLKAGKALAGFLSEDYDRLQAILRSVI
ncbi:hypothetical protein CCAX7_003790 [Capsulimonas corticalis]|uniref:Uncharacterized protein n=1 Tax=Capsulimonas corticalis TaxID=2219043 RepID=A0A402D365_9BACT|nr:hypothetical protein [Capsulimonas corticalis]BDI28328.1 hypothetical protein CCAX7_003790 [Capsulimonas corticalis]